MESSKAWLDGLIVRQLSPVVSNYRSTSTLSDFCAAQGVVGIAEVDTRALTRRLRDTGAMVGVICTDPAVPDADLLAQARGWTLDGKDMISVVSTEKQYKWTAQTDAEWCARLLLHLFFAPSSDRLDACASQGVRAGE